MKQEEPSGIDPVVPLVFVTYGLYAAFILLVRLAF